jgi:Domain of unknown function (DUF427)
VALSELRTFCPYKGIALYYDIEGAKNAAWSYRARSTTWGRSATWCRSNLTASRSRLDAKRLKVERGQSVTAHGIDRNLDVDEAGAPTAAIGRGSSAFFSLASEGATREATS